MANANTDAGTKMPEFNEDFEALLNANFDRVNEIEGSVLKGTVVKLDSDCAMVDVGLKSEGRIPLREFGANNELKVDDTIDV
jgi:small subunit ribosomal protein S1